MTQALDISIACPGQAEFGGGGEGEGASAFTDLTDAPSELPLGGSLVSSDSEGTALQCLKIVGVENFRGEADNAITSLHFSSFDDEEYSDPSAGVSFSTLVEETGAVATFALSAFHTSGSVDFQAKAIATDDSLLLRLSVASEVQMLFSGPGGLTLAVEGDLKLDGMDVTASDTNARLTVGETSYAIDKAVQVKIGNNTYYWPLFGGEDAGPAPASGGL